MNKLATEEFEFTKTHLKIVEQIVVTSACSNIPPDYLDGLREINKKYHYTQCVTCNSSIFLATNRLYKDYLFTKEQEEKENVTRKEKESKSRRSSKANKVES